MKIDKRNIEDIIALSPMQEGLLFHYLKEPQSDLYFEQLSLKISGKMDRLIFEKAWSIVIDTNEMLRTVFLWENVQKPVQVVLKENKFKPIYYDFLNQNPAEKKKMSAETKLKDRLEKFYLNDVPFRVTLCKNAGDDYEMIVSNHHILYDGWSTGIILKEFFGVYNDIASGKEPLKPVKTKYKEFIKSNRCRNSDMQEVFWRDYLKGYDTRVELSIKKKRGKGKEAQKIGECKIRLSEREKSKLEDFVKKYKITLATFIYCSWGILLQKYNNGLDVVFGTTLSGRTSRIPKIEEMVGLLINTLPLRIKTGKNETVEELLFKINDSISDRAQHENSSLVKIKDYSELEKNKELFDSIVSVGNYPLDRRLTTTTGELLTLKSYSMFELSHYDLTIGITIFENIEFLFSYDEYLFDEDAVVRLTRHFRNVIDNILNYPQKKIADIELITGKEKKQILYEFNDTEADYPRHKTIHGLFEEKVEKVPDSIAVIYSAAQLTYEELNKKSHHLAKKLNAKGVGPDSIVGIIEAPSLEMIAGLIGVLKAGGAYLPIDPNYPGDRIRFMLADSGAGLILTGREKKTDFSKETISLMGYGKKEINNGDKCNLPVKISADNLAYVIFTSGTTGKPKGALIEHRNVVRLMFNDKYLFDFSAGDIWTMFHSFCFDFSVWEMYGALLYGGKLVLIPRMVARDPGQYLQVLKKEKVTVLNQTPSAFYNLIDEELKNKREALKIRYVIFGGEALNPYKLKEWRKKYPAIKLINMFGITETTVHVTFKEITEKEIEAGISNIGRPIPTLTAHILDSYLNLLPIGAPGELCVGGEGVGRGYLNRPLLTDEKFIKNPYDLMDRLYKSGDKARRLPNGDMEYSGRLDHQVKIRGVRIESGEIENRLIKHDKIKEAVVSVTEKKTGAKCLTAYIVLIAPHRSGSLMAAELRDFLSEELPDNMIPANFVVMEKFPLTSNGKIDRKNLPEPEGKTLESGTEYRAPGNVIEEKLVETWQKVLGRDKIGIDDDFFMIGGDSIKTIQIAAKMKEAGYKVEVKDVLQNPAISQLAPFVKKLEIIPDQSSAVGRIPLTPIQKEFFSYPFKNPNHFNMSKILVLKNRLDEELIRSIFTKMQEHHDILRVTYKVDNGEISQVNHDSDYPLSLKVFDFRDRQEAANAVEIKVNEIQRGINLERGPLMKLALFRLYGHDLLLILFHHLVIDGVSWRILFEDMETLYRQYQKGEQLFLPLKTDSFKVWAEKLSRYADNKEFLKEKVYWSELESEIVPALQRDYEVESNLVKDTAQLSFHLTKMETHHLLTKVNNSFNTEINDILLTALGLGIKKTFGINSIPIALEGHGREKIFKDIDVNRTFGWFTIVYHIILNFSNAHRLPRQIKDIKETLRQVPNKGIGFGILKYLTSTEFKKGIDFKLKPQICFNYLGQFDLDLGQLSFAQTEMSIDNSIGSDESRKYDFDISGSIENGRLVMRISYGRQQYKIETIEKLRKNYEAELKRIISYCLTGDEKKFTPSDLTYGKLSIDEVEQLEKEYRFSDIYPLSPMQEVMYFHSIYNKNSTFYFEYRSFCLHGNLNIRFVEKSFNELLKRHDILRTVFIRDMSERPLQIVLKERNVAFYYEDISKQEGKDDFLRNFKENDKKRLFDLGKDVLMRIAVLKTASSGYEFIWSHHHILMDGWCMGILLTEFFDIYTSFAAGREPGLPKVKQYREYINWLESRDREVSRKYWRDYLYDYKQTAGLPGNHREECVRKYRQEEVAFQISREEKEELERLSAANNVTFSTLLQTIWGILLSKYNNCKDVVFGAVVSGRPAEIVGVESIVGLFINTIPVRIRYEEDTKFTGLLKKVQAGALASEPHHHYQLADIQADSALKEKLINHNITFENYPISKQIAGLVVGSIEKNSEFAFEISGLEILEQNNFDFSFIIIPHDGLHGKFWFNSFVFDRDFVREIADTFCEMIKQINKNPEIKISRIKTLSDDVHRREIAQFTDDLENE